MGFVWIGLNHFLSDRPAHLVSLSARLTNTERDRMAEGGTVAHDRLRSFIERIERLEEEKCVDG